jgi:hypothetical protein
MLFMINIFRYKFNRRHDFYAKCQDAIDYLHDSVTNGNFVDEIHCKNKFGEDVYSAISHQLRAMNASVDYTTITAAMNWLYYTQYFTHKSCEEKLLSRYYTMSVILSSLSFIIAAISLCITLT